MAADAHQGHRLVSKSKRENGLYLFRMWCKSCGCWADDAWHYGDPAKTEP